MKEEVRVFICTHKDYPILNNEWFKPLIVGKNLKDKSEYLRDNAGDNISDKNKNYSELTGLYWIWKNTNYKYKGIFHYRRYLKLKKRNFSNIYSLNYDERLIKKILKEADIILPTLAGVEGITIEKNYKESHISEDWDEMMKVIKELYPGDYQLALEVFSKDKFYPLNMLITKKEIFDDYCEWLFSILFALEKRIKISEDPYQARVFGFLSERLMRVYIEKKKLKVKEVKVLKIDENGNIEIRNKFLNSLKKRIRWIKNILKIS